jgi:hypothetical protein
VDRRHREARLFPARRTSHGDTSEIVSGGEHDDEATATEGTSHGHRRLKSDAGRRSEQKHGPLRADRIELTEPFGIARRDRQTANRSVVVHGDPTAYDVIATTIQTLPQARNRNVSALFIALVKSSQRESGRPHVGHGGMTSGVRRVSI